MNEREKERTPVQHTYGPPIHDGDDSTNYKVNCRLYTIITAQVSLPFARRPVMCHSRTPKWRMILPACVARSFAKPYNCRGQALSNCKWAARPFDNRWTCFQHTIHFINPNRNYANVRSKRKNLKRKNWRKDWIKYFGYKGNPKNQIWVKMDLFFSKIFKIYINTFVLYLFLKEIKRQW